MQLPVDEENNEQMVGVPKSFKVCPPLLLHSVPDHEEQCKVHDPAGGTWACSKIRNHEDLETFKRGRSIWIDNGEFGKVEHVGDDVDDGADDDGPTGGFVEGYVFVEGDDIVEGSATDEGDEGAADGEEDESDVDMEGESGGTGDGCNGRQDNARK